MNRALAIFIILFLASLAPRPAPARAQQDEPPPESIQQEAPPPDFIPEEEPPTDRQDTPAFELIPPAPATGRQPVPAPAPSEKGNGRGTIVVESADYSKYDTKNKLTALKGNIFIKYTEAGREGEIQIRGQEAVVDEKAGIATAKGGVTVRDGDLEISGETLFYKFKDKYFEMSRVSGSAEGGGKDVKGKMYFQGERAQGTERKIKIFHSTFSTCGPHCASEYHLAASDISIFPDKKVIARKVGVYLRHTRVMYMPVYVASLKEEESYRPEFGYNKTEGFYVKTKYPYIAEAPAIQGRQASTAWLILDYVQKTGNRYGTENKYYSDKIGGDGFFQYITNNAKTAGYTNRLTKLSQKFVMGKKFSGNLDTNRTDQYSIYSAGSRTNTNTINFSTNYNQSAGKTLSTNYSLTANKGRSEMENGTINIARRTRFGKKVTVDYNFNETYNQSDAVPKNEEGSFKSTTNYMGRAYRLSVVTFKSFDMDGDTYLNDRSVSVNNTQLPEATLTLDPRLWKKTLPYLTTFKLVHGRYRRGTRNNSEALRRNELTAMATKQYNFGKFTLTPRQTYTQRLYSTKDAMYVMEHSTAASYKFKEGTTLSANYNRTGDSGGTPYSADRRSEAINLNGRFEILKKHTDPLTRAAKNTSSFSMATTYNYKSFTYSPLQISYTKATTQNTQFQINGSKNLNTHRWDETATTKFDIKRKNTRMMLNASWATRDFDLNNLYFTTEHTRRNGWKTQIRGQYQHKNQHGIIRNIVATKTRCCTEMQFFYDVVNKEFKFQYYILAFPTRKFGFTQGSQGLEIDDTFMEFQSEEQAQ